ncbi:hypothetical protein OHA10_31980 [Kribbella sp. NBC_00662]|uniref:protealysin inhibitor emfourin n=1 Tax=Kribbella sp. NBC_00662 TaxID=2975969 RepID=UPI00324901FD
MSGPVTLRGRSGAGSAAPLRNPKSRADLLVRGGRRVRDDGNEGQLPGTPGSGRIFLIIRPGVSRGHVQHCEEEATVIVTVTRSGGFAGMTKHAELDTSGEPDAAELEDAVRALGAKDLGSGRPQPDRYVYRLVVRDAAESDATQHTVAEQDVDATTAWLLDRILGS